MATPNGTVSFDAGGEAHTLRFTTNALCLFEQRSGMTQLEAAQELAFAKDTPLGVSAKTLRALYWAGTGKGDMTLEQAGDLVDSIGRREAVRIAIEAFDAAFPEAEKDDKDKDGDKDGDHPPKAAAG
jgi:hypothetical protein